MGSGARGQAWEVIGGDLNSQTGSCVPPNLEDDAREDSQSHLPHQERVSQDAAINTWGRRLLSLAGRFQWVVLWITVGIGRGHAAIGRFLHSSPHEGRRGTSRP